jgi:hypothetical protein
MLVLELWNKSDKETPLHISAMKVSNKHHTNPGIYVGIWILNQIL